MYLFAHLNFILTGVYRRWMMLMRGSDKPNQAYIFISMSWLTVSNTFTRPTKTTYVLRLNVFLFCNAFLSEKVASRHPFFSRIHFLIYTIFFEGRLTLISNNHADDFTILPRPNDNHPWATPPTRRHRDAMRPPQEIPLTPVIYKTPD